MTCAAGGGRAGHWLANRRRMVALQLEARGVADPRVLEAMGGVPRHEFAPAGERARSYGDHPLPIGHGQTISQPYIVAWMSALLAPLPDMEVLEIGAGSGYQTAVLARLCAHVWAIERIPALAAGATEALARQGVANATVRCGDGAVGWPARAPFPRILVAAAAKEAPAALVDQLANGGRMVLPVGSGWRGQRMMVVEKDHAGEVRLSRLGGVAFVPLVAGD